MLKYCPKCGKRTDDSMNFCLEDGSFLLESSSQETLAMPAEQKMQFEPPDADRRIESALDALFDDLRFAEFKYDERFKRLIARYRSQGFNFVFSFVENLLGRQEIAVRKKNDNYDPIALYLAIGKNSADETDAVLKEHGLI